MGNKRRCVLTAASICMSLEEKQREEKDLVGEGCGRIRMPVPVFGSVLRFSVPNGTIALAMDSIKRVGW